MPLLQRSLSAIGVDIGSRMIKAAQLEGHRDNRYIRALTMVPRIHPAGPVDAEEVTHLKAVLKRQGFKGQDLVLAVPEKQLRRGIFELPPADSGAPIEQIARMEMARMHHLDPHSFEMICWGATSQGPEATEAQTVAVAVPHEQADALLDAVEACGLSVQALDARTAATARACGCLTVPPPGLTAIVDLGWGSTKLLLVSGRTVLYERLLRSELAQLNDRLSQRFGVSPDRCSQLIDHIGLARSHDIDDLDGESLAVIQQLLESHFRAMLEELTVPFNYAARQYDSGGVQRLILTGGGAVIPGLADFIEQNLRIPVRPASPADLLQSRPEILAKARHPGLTVAVGLALFTEN